MKLTGRFWLECEGVKVFGMGPCALLEAVDRAGTLSQAADELGMSYSKAWSIIKRAESKKNRFNCYFVSRKVRHREVPYGQCCY